MATRAQAKAAIDTAATSAKAKIDTLPSTVNIVDGGITFAPTGLAIVMNETTIAAAEALATAIQTANSGSTIHRFGRREGETPDNIVVRDGATRFIIQGFTF